MYFHWARLNEAIAGAGARTEVGLFTSTVANASESPRGDHGHRRALRQQRQRDATPRREGVPPLVRRRLRRHPLGARDGSAASSCVIMALILGQHAGDGLARADAGVGAMRAIGFFAPPHAQSRPRRGRAAGRPRGPLSGAAARPIPPDSGRAMAQFGFLSKWRLQALHGDRHGARGGGDRRGGERVSRRAGGRLAIVDALRRQERSLLSLQPARSILPPALLRLRHRLRPRPWWCSCSRRC